MAKACGDRRLNFGGVDGHTVSAADQLNCTTQVKCGLVFAHTSVTLDQGEHLMGTQQQREQTPALWQVVKPYTEQTLVCCVEERY
eukprot:351634-Chlamydomonas_euryale.AAC.4